MLNNNFEFTLHDEVADPDGNKLILDITINNKRLALINIYSPNKDTSEFYEIIKNDIITYGNNIILAANFNLVLDPEIDTLNYKTKLIIQKQRKKFMILFLTVALLMFRENSI